MNRFALAWLLVAGCSSSGPAGDDTTSDAPAGCSVYLQYPTMAVAGPSTQITITAKVMDAPGVLTYTWQLKHGGAPVTYDYALLDQSAISFTAADAGPYDVMVAVAAPGSFCPTAQGTVNVGVEGGNISQIRLRVYPPPTIAAPPSERLVLVTGGANFSAGTVPVDPGVVATGSVKLGTTGVPSYLRFIPAGARDAYVEGFTNTDGSFSVRVLNQLHDVLVVPIVPGYAPRLVTGWMPGTALVPVDAGIPLSGVVRDPQGAGIANAQVQLVVDGVPSTLATTSGTGAFTVLAPAMTGTITVDVTPPPATGLPRIAATGAFTGAAYTIQYDAGLVRRDLGGAVVRRGGTAQPNAPVKIVGTIAAVATVTSGATANANGEVRIATTTNGSGAIPNGTLAPAAPLAAVSTIGSQLAVGAVDLTSSVPATIDAPAAVQIDTQLRDTMQTALPGAVLELQPVGPLALAGAPTIRATANASGNISLLVPAGGRFDVRASDPLGRGAPLTLVDVPTTNLGAAYALLTALHVTGSLMLSGNPQPVGRATVQVLCTSCTGVDRTRPLAESASTSAGGFDVAVFDPGAN